MTTQAPTLTHHLQHRAFTQAHAAHQDGLVQAYRQQLWGFELGCGLLVGVGAFLTMALTGPVSVLAAAWTGATLVLHQRSGAMYREAISFRQKDVDWAQKQLMLAETFVPPSMRTFTRFKVYQDRDPATLAEKQALFLSSENTATEDDVHTYFYSHQSKSRAKAALILDTVAQGVKVAGLLTIGLALYRLF